MSAIDRENGAPGQEDFLSRWSRRKLEGETETDRTETEPAAPAAGEAEPPLTDRDMPPLDSLTQESEYSGFLSPEVSEELRRLALRKLFHSPMFNVRDGLDDYDEDFTSFVRLGDLITADMRHRLEQEARRIGEAEPAADAPPDDDEAVEEADAETPPAQAEAASNPPDNDTPEKIS